MIETAKSIQSFANIVVGIIFLKHFWEYRDLESLLIGVSLWLNFYLLAIALMNKVKAEAIKK